MLVETEVSASNSFTWWTWLQIFVLVGGLVFVNSRQMKYLWHDWQLPNWSHGYLIILFSIYLVYARFSQIAATVRKTWWPGLVVVLFAAGLHIYAYIENNTFACQFTMVLMAAALLLFLAGRDMFKLAWLPVLYLILALPVPDVIYNQIALHLQNFATVASSMMLELGGATIESENSMLLVTTVNGNVEPLRVEEACSGLRLLTAFIALSVAMAYLTDRPLWQRVVLFGLAIPVAIAANVLRVVITSIMFIVERREFGEKFMHEFTGMLMLIPAGLLLLLASWIMKRLFVEVDDEEEGDAAVEEAS
jgi:exosortase